MHRCLSCHSSFPGEAWTCPGCGWAPATADGRLLFAPEIADDGAGMAEGAHHVLAEVQHRSFWFRARNRLVDLLIRRLFADARQVLEVGCGSGYVLAQLRRSLPEADLWGSEVQAYALEYADQQLNGRARLVQMDARRIPFEDEFDLIAAMDVLEHIYEDETVLSEMHRALKPGGGLLLSVPQHPALWSTADAHGGHHRRYLRRELQDKVRRAGFEIERTTSFVSLLMLPMLLRRRTAGQAEDYDASAEFELPGWLDRSFEATLWLERMAIAAGLSLPFGGTRIIVARRAG